MTTDSLVLARAARQKANNKAMQRTRDTFVYSQSSAEPPSIASASAAASSLVDVNTDPVSGTISLPPTSPRSAHLSKSEVDETQLDVHRRMSEQYRLYPSTMPASDDLFKPVSSISQVSHPPNIRFHLGESRFRDEEAQLDDAFEGVVSADEGSVQPVLSDFDLVNDRRAPLIDPTHIIYTRPDLYKKV